MATNDFFRARLDTMIDLRHRWAVLATRMPWAEIEAALAPAFAHRDRLVPWPERAERMRSQRPHDKGKLYALHAPEVECIGKGKARKPFEFDVKVSLAVTHRHGLVVGARSFPGNPYDGHTLAEQIEQTRNLLQDVGVEPKAAIVDLGYRGVNDVVPVEVIHRGKSKTLTAQQRGWLRRRQAIEPAIGHAKSDHGMNRCWLKGSDGDALHAVLCAARFNIRWLLRAIARLGLQGLLWALNVLVLYGRLATDAAPTASGRHSRHWPPALRGDTGGSRRAHPMAVG